MNGKQTQDTSQVNDCAKPAGRGRGDGGGGEGDGGGGGGGVVINLTRQEKPIRTSKPSEAYRLTPKSHI